MPDSLDYSRKPVLILGASGFIGARLVAALSAGTAYQPIAASRHPGRHPGADGIALDATDPSAMQAALRGVGRVVNCIAGSDSAMVRSTQALCDAARVAPPGRVVHLSSMAVYGAATGAVQEDHPVVRPISGYGRAKAESERIIQKYVHDGGDAVILRPTCVFGPGSSQWTTRLARLLEARRIGDLGPAGDGCCNLAFIDDAVTAIIHALDAPEAAGRTFNISSTAALTWNEFLVRFARALGATPVKRVPSRMLKLEVKVLAPLCKIAGKAVHAPWTEAITPSLAALWAQDIHIDSSAAVAALSMPQTPPDQMIAAAVNWLRGGAASASRTEFASP
jgi:nucleoside-diphosphate-sugar epimerase